MLLICFVVSVWSSVLVPTSPEEKNSNHEVETPRTPTLTIEQKGNDILKEKDLKYTVMTPTIRQKTTSVRYSTNHAVPPLLGQRDPSSNEDKNPVIAPTLLGQKDFNSGSNEEKELSYGNTAVVTPTLLGQKGFSSNAVATLITPASLGQKGYNPRSIGQGAGVTSVVPTLLGQKDYIDSTMRMLNGKGALAH
jgi:hypothetical protein